MTDLEFYLTKEERDEAYGLHLANAFAGPFPANEIRLAELETVALDRRATHLGVPCD